MTRSGTIFYARYSSSRVLIDFVGFGGSYGARQFGSGKLSQNIGCSMGECRYRLLHLKLSEMRCLRLVRS